MQKLWWQDEGIRAWAWRAWRYYSWRPGYQFRLSVAEATAYVDMQNKVVVCNPQRPLPPAKYLSGVRHLPAGGERGFQLAYLESLIAHEAGHTQFTDTDSLPPGLLGQLVNIIEDERMERLMVQDFPKLAPLLTMAGDADAAHWIDRQGAGGDVIGGCLLWRFTWNHPVWAYKPDGPDAHLWPQVKEILEVAWTAPHYDDVVLSARRILALTGRDHEEQRPELSDFCDGEALMLNGGEERGKTRQDGAEGDGAGQQGKRGQPAAGQQEQEDGEDESGTRTDDGAARDEGEGERTRFGPGSGGQDAPQRPTPEQPPTAQSEALKVQTLGDARRLAAALRVPCDPDSVRPSRDRGRFRYDRYVAGSERPFDRRMGGGSPGETHLRLAVDISASMVQGGRITQARRMAFTVVQAAQMAGIAVLAVAFDERVQSLVEPSARPQNALNAVAALNVRGDTCLSPALRALWTPELSGQSVTLIITDGQLSAGDYAACGTLKAAHSGAVVPILLGTDVARPAYERAFGVCVQMDDPAQLTNHVIAFLRAWQARLWR
ncbi:vWA domain-containing protein [Deinococcus marmoris]|uniref:VWFA domain-containing protein n=1 Tax=Deinococcus marmoris TaxID=249408 RepID=A0A1U7NR14_9DEIO|nr:vWA domain-containing protein [Deinococcus marmoris]OLV15362.1 hypothetical protein BOO71_0015142 [Deinococcus marmoris]